MAKAVKKYSGRNGNSAAMVNPKGPQKRAARRDGTKVGTYTYTNKGKSIVRNKNVNTLTGKARKRK